MAYKILSIIQNGETITTKIKYILTNGEKLIIDVSHWRPKSKDDILQGITNREISEQAKLDAIKDNEKLVKELAKEIK